MSDYGADPNPNLAKITMIAFGFALAALDNLKADQFSTADPDKKVYSIVRKIGSTRLLVLVDPDEVPTGDIP